MWLGEREKRRTFVARVEVAAEIAEIGVALSYIRPKSTSGVTSVADIEAVTKGNVSDTP